MDGPLDVRARLHQLGDDRRVAGTAGLQQRGDPIAIARSKVRAGREERADHWDIRVVYGPKQRRGAITRRLVDVDMFSEERADGLEITVSRSNDDGGIRRLPGLHEDRGE